MVSVIIRATEVSDCEGIAAIFQCPGVLKNTLRMPYRSVEATRQRLANLPATTHSLVAVDADTHNVIGNLGLIQQ